jgi:hypothetical protein
LTDHPTSTEIARLARGTLPREGRRRLVAHLLAGCPRCARLAARALALNPRLLERHVLRAAGRAAKKGSPRGSTPAEATAATAGTADAADTAATAGTAATVATAATADVAAEAEDPGQRYERPVARACAAAMRRLREFERERRNATPRLPATAMLDRGSTGGELPRVRGLLRVEMLLAASWDLRYSDAHEMLRLAELALFAAERLEQARYGRATVADVRARVWAELANALRVGDDIVRAELAMTRAVSWVHRGSGDPWLLARVADLMASLLADQRRFADAGELLDKVHAFYGRLGNQHLAGRALISRGIFAGYDNQPRRALSLLLQGLDLLDIQQDARLAVHAVHALLLNLVDCGRYRQARIHLWRCRTLFAQHGGRLSLLRLRWLEGRIHAGLGELERAERELLATRQGFAAAGNPYHTALVALDLAAVWLRQGKTLQVRQLVEEMIAAFRALRIAREAVAALLILREACDRDEATLDRVRTVAMLLTELERQPRRLPALGAVDVAEGAASEGAAD